MRLGELVGGLCILLAGFGTTCVGQEIIPYNNPGLTVDLGVGLWAWPMPVDWDGDGDLDLIVSCPDVPHNGTFFFENPGVSGQAEMPIFKPAVRIGPALKDVTLSRTGEGPRVLSRNTEWTNFLGGEFKKRHKVLEDAKIHHGNGNMRFNVWRYVDFNADDRQDILVGADDWGEYGWDDGFDAAGNWLRGPLRGAVYVLIDQAASGAAQYSAPKRLMVGDTPIDTYGNPMPNLADFDGDGDLDLLCGEFLDGFSYFENRGTRTEPQYAPARRLEHDGQAIHMHVQMITPTAIDWDQDGHVDIVCGDEDGRVALIRNTGKAQFLPPVYFQQQARDLKFGALVTPVGVDWDGDGDDDLICGNTSGNIAWIENLDGAAQPKWSPPKLLTVGGVPIHILAGPNGSIQGPAEAKWGYTTLDVADWDHDGRLDLVVNSIFGSVNWYRNTGHATDLAAAKPVSVEWGESPPPKPSWTWWNPGKNELLTQWRTTPLVVDWNRDGKSDLISLDHEGYLALFPRVGPAKDLRLAPGERIFEGGSYDSNHNQKSSGGLLQLNSGANGSSGRCKLCMVDWDGDGKVDLLCNARNADSTSIIWMRNMGQENGRTRFQDAGSLGARRLAGHTTSPTVVDWNRDGIPDLVIGAEDGRLYFVENPRSK